jgi:hypothetical protein
MAWDDWDFEGHESRVEYWRSIVPALSVSPDADQTGTENSLGRVAGVQQRYLLELKRIGGGMGARSELTRVSDWSPLAELERREGRSRSPFALCRGVPSGMRRAPRSEGWQEALDFALMVWTVPALMPRGALFLDGVPLIIARRPPNQPLANIEARTGGVAVIA